MELSEAIRLIAGLPVHDGEVWADLGCGVGFFTRALIHVYPELKEIYGVDKAEHSDNLDTKVKFLKADFITGKMDLPLLDGVFMANSLHFVKDKLTFIENSKNYFKDQKGKWLIIEYDQSNPSHWVPYPIDFEKLNTLFSVAGYKNIEYFADRDSTYGRKMYSAFIN